MSDKPGPPDEAPAPGSPPADEAGATFLRPISEDGTQDLLGSRSISTGGERDTDLPRLRPDELLAGRFSIVRFIARGGMGAVYEAADLILNTHVALKLIRSPLVADTSALERFRRELLLARRVGHPNVCHVYEFYDARTAAGVPVHFLTMELLEGETLAARLAQMTMQVDEARRHDQIFRVKNFRALRARRKLPVRRDGGDAVAVEENVARCVRPAGGIENAPIPNQQHAKNPFRRKCPRRQS